MADRQFRVVLTGDNAGLVGAATGASAALKSTGSAADDLAKKTDGAKTASSGMTRELIVLAHELSQGQYSRFGGSLLVLAEYSKSATAALGLLVGPAGAAIAVLGGFVVAAARGAAESKALTDALISNLVGFIEQQFAKMVYDQYLAKYAAQLGSTIFSGISNLFQAGAGLSTEDYGSSGFATGSNPDYSNEGIHMATGTNYVPYDGLRAVLHKGEAVVPKEYNPAAGGTADGAIHLTIAPVFHGGVTRNDLVNGMQTAVQMAVGQVANLRRRGSPAFVGS